MIHRFWISDSREMTILVGRLRLGADHKDCRQKESDAGYQKRV